MNEKKIRENIKENPKKQRKIDDINSGNANTMNMKMFSHSNFYQELISKID